MDLNNKKHVVTFIVVAGIAAFLLKAALSAIFIVSLPMAPDWCLDYQEVQVGPDEYEGRCFDFKDEYEEAKYDHNRGMVERNKTLLFVEFVFWFCLTALTFYWVPKWKGQLHSRSAEAFFPIGFLAFAVAVIMPLILSWLLPPPVQWFPEVFRELNDVQVESKLREIESSL